MNISDLVNGYERFKNIKFKKYENKFLDLVENGQHPKVLFIACSDSRVNPAFNYKLRAGRSVYSQKYRQLCT